MIETVRAGFAIIATVSALGMPYATESQQPARISSGGAAGGGTIEVVIADEDPALSGRSRGAWLSRAGESFCDGSAGGDHVLAFTNVPSGQYGVHVGSLGIFRPDPITVEVVPGETVRVEIPARLEDAVLECARFSEGCKQLLATEAQDWLPKERHEWFEYWKVALALAGAGDEGSEEWIACLGPYPDDALARAVMELHSEIVRENECGLANGGLGRMVHNPTGRPGRVVTMQLMDLPRGRELWVPYSRHSLDGASFSCDVVEEDGERRGGRCATVVVW